VLQKANAGHAWAPTSRGGGLRAGYSSFGPCSLCSFGLSATSHQYFSLRTNQPPATSQRYFSLSQQYFSLRINQHPPSATSQTKGRWPADNVSRGAASSDQARALCWPVGMAAGRCCKRAHGIGIPSKKTGEETNRPAQRQNTRCRVSCNRQEPRWCCACDPSFLIFFLLSSFISLSHQIFS
jgi:hypothetical protein